MSLPEQKISMRKLLIPVDGSDNALRAVEYAAKAARREPDLQFELLNVQEPFTPKAYASLSHEEISRLLTAEAKRILRPASQILDRAGVRNAAHYRIGEIGPAIADHVRENGCDAVIMGTRGMGAVGNLVLGSIATKVIHLVDVPVTLIK